MAAHGFSEYSINAQQLAKRCLSVKELPDACAERIQAFGSVSKAPEDR